jgi:colanic acid biosynthesis glycosyl transferase WcaI
MRVFILSCVFPPEPVVSAKTSAEIAEFIASKGNEVTVITSFPNRPSGNIYPGYKRRFISRDVQSKEYKTVRCFATFSRRSSLRNRFAENITFGITSGLAALFMPKPDVIFSNTWPIFATGIITCVARLRKIPLVISVQDIYPESLLAQNRISPHSFVVHLLKKIDRGIARRCRSLIVISNTFAEIYRKAGLPADQIHVVPNWGNPNMLVTDASERRDLRYEFSIPEDSFVCVYAGNIGMASGVDTCIEAFNYIKPTENICLLIAGEGSQLMACQALANHVDTDRIKILSPWPTQKTTAVLSTADCFLLPTQGKQSLASVPSKLISYLFAGKPIISGSLPQSETAKTVIKARCGVVVNPSDPEGLAAAISTMSALPNNERKRMGVYGKMFAHMHFSSKACLPHIDDIIRNA